MKTVKQVAFEIYVELKTRTFTGIDFKYDIIENLGTSYYKAVQNIREHLKDLDVSEFNEVKGKFVELGFKIISDIKEYLTKIGSHYASMTDKERREIENEAENRILELSKKMELHICDLKRYFELRDFEKVEWLKRLNGIICK